MLDLMLKVLLNVLLVLIPPVLCSATAVSPTAQQVVAWVGGEPIYVDELSANSGSTQQSAQQTADQRFDALMTQAVAAAKARQIGLDKQVAVQRDLEAIRRQAAAEAFRDDLLAVNTEVSDADARNYFQQYSDMAKAYVIRTTDAASAQEARERLLAGDDPLAVARQYDIAGAAYPEPSVTSRGTQPPVIADLVFNTQAGAASEVQPYEMGFAVAMVVEKRSSDAAAFEAKKADIKAAMAASQRQGIVRHYIEQRVNAVGVFVDTKFLAETGVRADIPGSESHVVGRAGDQEIVYGELVAKLQSTFGHQQSSHVSGPRIKEQILRRMLEGVVLQNDALAKGYADQPWIKGSVLQKQRAVLASAAAQHLATLVPEPSDADIRRYYEDNREDTFRGPETLALAHILLRTREQAEDIVADLKDGASFADFAARHSTDVDSAQRGGSIGDFDDARLRALDPALADAVLTLQPGQNSDVVQSRFGFHIVRLESRTQQPPQAFETVQELVRTRVRRADMEAAWQRWLHADRGTVDIRFDAVQLAAVGVSAAKWR